MRGAPALLVGFLLASPSVAQEADPVPDTLWDHRSESGEWNRAAIDALKDHGDELVEATPVDVGRFCPAYVNADDAERRAFWVGFLSALAEYESTWKPGAVGGGGQWYGLLQILPATAREYGCRAKSGNALLDGAANLSCAIRIMAETVPRDGAIHGDGSEGVAADWGPLQSEEKRAEMGDWLRGQEYCVFGESLRPRPRPQSLAADDGGKPSRDLVTRDKLAGEAD
jgi:hypothetical protein